MYTKCVFKEYKKYQGMSIQKNMRKKKLGQHVHQHYIRVNKCINITYVVQRQVLQNVKNKGNRQESKIIKNAKMLHKKLYYRKNHVNPYG